MDMKDRIAALKERNNMTTEDLSIKSGVPIGTINKILNGETPNPRLSTSKALAKALNCSLDFLTGESDYRGSLYIAEDTAEYVINNTDTNTLLEMLKNDPSLRMVAKINGELSEEGKRDLLKYAELLRNQRDTKWDD